MRQFLAGPTLMKIPKPKPHNPMPPPAEVHKDQRKEASRRACRKLKTQDLLNEPPRKKN
jgi:hypothetical protein